MQDAINYAAQKVKLKDYGVTVYPKKMSQFDQIFKSMDEDEISARFIKNKIGIENYKMFDQMTNPKLQEGVMMKMPFEIKIN